MESYKPYKYQVHGEQHLIKNRYAALFLEMGLGKTVITLTVLMKLIHFYMEVGCVLIIAPKRVASKVWPDELKKWPHLSKLTYSMVLGNERQRIKALAVKKDIYIINRENVAWLVAYYGDRWPFECVVIDESSSFKNQNSERFKALYKHRPKTYRIIELTGTPAPNSLIDLYPQIKLLDMGERLGKTITYFRDNFCTTKKVTSDVITYRVIPGMEKKIYDHIKDICISMKTRDYLDLPPFIERVIDIELSGKVMKMYYQFEKEQVLKLINNEKEISAASAGALSTKLRQFASGFIYDEDGKAFDVHSYKMDALEEYVDVLNGKPLIVFYWFRHSRELLLKKFKKLKPLTLKTDADIDTWNRGKSSLFLLHPGSGGHGLNLQAGGCTQIWYENLWSLELLLQANARLMRPGQKYSVISSKMKALGTIDERMIESNINKEEGQNALMKATRALIKKYS
jgi:SNF2 family DNA or RNA helicase